MKKVLVLVLGFDKEPWRSIENLGQRKTWGTYESANTPVYYYFGVTQGIAYWYSAVRSKLLHLMKLPKVRDACLRRIGPQYKLQAKEAGSRIDVDIPDFYGNIGAKTLGALRHVLKHHDFDYIYRTNSSSYVYLPLLERFIQSIPETGYYGGWVGTTNGIPFVNGDAILMSRDMVEVVTKDPLWDWDLMDDVAIARSMMRHDIKPQSFSRLELNSPTLVNDVSVEDWKSCFQVRCKTSSDRLLDIETLNRVHDCYSKVWNG